MERFCTFIITIFDICFRVHEVVNAFHSNKSGCYNIKQTTEVPVMTWQEHPSCQNFRFPQIATDPAAHPPQVTQTRTLNY